GVRDGCGTRQVGLPLARAVAHPAGADDGRGARAARPPRRPPGRHGHRPAADRRHRPARRPALRGAAGRRRLERAPRRGVRRAAGHRPLVRAVRARPTGRRHPRGRPAGLPADDAARGRRGGGQRLGRGGAPDVGGPAAPAARRRARRAHRPAGQAGGAGVEEGPRRRRHPGVRGRRQGPYGAQLPL
ncbi:MAG: hypothetical protein AVDCRST_MAG06-1796, partial [uncultured Nocardioides sp.]